MSRLSDARNTPLRILALISGGGRTVVNLARAIDRDAIPARLVGLISSRPGVAGLDRAEKLAIPARVVDRKACGGPEPFATEMWTSIREFQPDLICLAGFLSFLPIPDDWTHRILNIHPALLPSFGGKGMYGHRVHQAVLDYGCKVSGCTVHFADDRYDTGPILVQRACPVHEDDTPDTLAARVFAEECLAYPHAVRLIAEGRVAVQGRRVRIAEAGQIQ